MFHRVQGWDSMYSSYTRRRVRVLDSYMYYVDTRAGEHTIVFLHGSLTTSYVWRNVLPHIQGYARCIAPDLLGMGNSGQLEVGGYGFETQYRYLCAWIRSIGLTDKLIFVGYEWGAGLAARWLYENPDRSKGLIHIEGILSPIRSINDINSKTFQKLVEFAKSTEVIPDSQECIQEIREKLGYYVSEISLTNIQFTESGPLANPADSAAAMVAGLREMPLEDSEQSESDIAAALREVYAWLSRSVNLPKLVIECDPGLFSAWVVNTTDNWPNQNVVTVEAKHFPQESCPQDVGNAIRDFVKRHFQSQTYRRYDMKNKGCGMTN